MEIIRCSQFFSLPEMGTYRINQAHKWMEKIINDIGNQNVGVTFSWTRIMLMLKFSDIDALL